MARPQFPPGSYADNVNSDGSLKWHHVKIVSGDSISMWNIVNNHGIAVNGMISGVIYSEITVDGVSLYNVTLEDVLSNIVNRDN